MSFDLVQSTTRRSRELENVARDVYQTAMYGLEQRRDAERVSEGIRAKIEFGEAYGQAVERMKTASLDDLRSTNYLEDVEGQIRERIGNVRDPELRGMMIREAGVAKGHAVEQHRAIYFQKNLEDQQATSLKNTQRLVSRAISAAPTAQAPSQADAWKQVEDEHIRTLAVLRMTGVWTAEQEYALAKRFYRETGEALIAQDPKKAEAFINQFKDEIEGDDYRKMKALLDQKLKEKKSFDAYAALHKEFEGDPQKMRAALLDPDRARALELDPSEIREAENLISDLEKTRAAVFEKTEAGYVSMAAVGKLKKSAIIADVNAGRISPVKGQHWIDKLEKDRDEKTDWMAFVKLEDKILRGGATVDDITKASGIGWKDRARLMSTLYTRSREVNRESEKAAKDYIKSQLVSTGPLGNPLPAEWERVYLAYQALDNYSDEARKAGKPWSLDQYMDYAKKLANHYRPTIQSKVQDQMTALQGGAQSPGTQGTPAAAQAAPKGPAKRKPGESIDDFLKRTQGGQ